MGTDQDQMLSLVYASTATQPFSDEDLTALLATSRENNARSGLTGMLVHRDGRFLQVLEGPEAAVRGLMDTLSADPRHTGIRVMFEEPIRERQFADWTMGFERADSGSAADLDGYRDTFDDLDRDDPTATMRALRELARWFRSRASR
ncbi:MULTISPECIES: BLUF domain-containing protein [unclassified Plantibacter]|uniref:BLUF domain-containing protein n=1 Tax=unclassified Plantibacter TaxID=2624265 RepID=UPI000B1C3D98|nr:MULTISPECIES: BLUF domain-containing protein [unclassified Plantibacter]